VTAEEIIEQGARSVGDILRSVPSANPGFSRVGPYQSFSLRIRGFWLTRCATASASAISGCRCLGPFEYRAGRSAERPVGCALWQSAVGGSVSVVTKQPQETTFASVAITTGQSDQKMLTIDMNTGLAPGLAVRITRRNRTLEALSSIFRIRTARTSRSTCSTRLRMRRPHILWPSTSSGYPGAIPACGSSARWKAIGVRTLEPQAPSWRRAGLPTGTQRRWARWSRPGSGELADTWRSRRASSIRNSTPASCRSGCARRRRTSPP